MKLRVRDVGAGLRFHEGARFDDVRRDRAIPEQRILKGPPGLLHILVRAVVAVRAVAIVGRVAIQVILQIAANARQVGLDGDADRLEMCGGSDA